MPTNRRVTSRIVVGLGYGWNINARMQNFLIFRRIINDPHVISLCFSVPEHRHCIFFFKILCLGSELRHWAPLITTCSCGGRSFTETGNGKPALRRSVVPPQSRHRPDARRRRSRAKPITEISSEHWTAGGFHFNFFFSSYKTTTVSTRVLLEIV